MTEASQKPSRFLISKLALWAIRWVIGFGLIWLVVSYYPDYSWLWWAGCLLAALSLAVIIVSTYILNRKLGEITEKIAAIDDEVSQ
ncbi:MAG: hypothetical protein DHS20C08_09440 [Rhodomicrobium sp.]|nr:MAG: hypothetical protein DHS20C08_09440 [Rhodomicrobium sp.]